jgi:hypothetical protein
MKNLASAIALSLLMPAGAGWTQEATATPTLSISPGETVTVRIEKGGFVELNRQPGTPQGARAEDTVRFTFAATGGSMLLRAENGYGLAFNYRARMFSGGRSAATSICTVMPRIMTMESWGNRIDRLELSKPRLTSKIRMSCQ